MCCASKRKNITLMTYAWGKLKHRCFNLPRGVFQLTRATDILIMLTKRKGPTQSNCNIFQMRTYVRKTQRGSTPKDVMERAVKAVVEGGQSYRAVGKDFGIDHITLYRYCKKFQRTSVMTEVGYKKIRIVFSDREEVLLAEYIEKAAKTFYGLSPKEIRKHLNSLLSIVSAFLVNGLTNVQLVKTGSLDFSRDTVA